MAEKVVEVLIPDGYKPKKVEREAAWILANHYKATVNILRPTMGYKEKTAYFQIGGECYELKTPLTAKTDKVLTDIMNATKQAGIVVIDMRKTKIIEKRMTELCGQAIRTMKKLDKLVLIVNKKKVLEFAK
ncbi:MAG: hypothetical protein LBG82_02435 [Clostridiales Family XIII bacterium]|jgi:ribosomal silencing factor RsfS|nr:hypothetical protein [Clostridiales Family XIII bacterium]